MTTGRRIAYLSLEATREGTAVYAHVHEIVAGLREEGWEVETFLPGYAAAGAVAAWRKLLEYARLQARVAVRLRGTDVLYHRCHFAAWPITALARLARVPVVGEVNGTYGDIFTTYPWLARLRGLVEGVQRVQYRAASRLVTVTPGLVAWVRQEAGHDRVTLIPNGANTRLFNLDAPPATNPRRYAIFVGGMTKWHGVETMLAAVSDPAWPADVELHLVGPTVDMDEGVIRAAEAREPRIRWLGRRPYGEIPGRLRGALAGIVATRATGDIGSTGALPLKLFEIMACGAPVVVSDLPGQSDLVREVEGGVVVPPDDPPALAAAIARLAADPPAAVRMGRAGARAVDERHSWRARAGETALAIRSVLEPAAA